jgi:hypothetical protein
MIRASALQQLILALALAGCAVLPQPAPTDAPVLPPAGAALAQVVFHVVPPAGTPADAGLILNLMDPVTGYPYNTRAYPMEPLGDGTWQVSTQVMPGSVLHYRYARSQPSASDEYSAWGEPISHRLAYVPSATLMEDAIAAWADAPYAGLTGRLIGTMRDSATGAAVRELIVTAGGAQTYTDSEGAFRIDGLVPGLHTLTVTSLDGAYLPVQQGAIIAVDSATPAEMTVEAARPIQVVFEVTLPEGTPTGQPLRLAGNLLQLGHAFVDQPGGIRNRPGAMPEMVQVDPTHALVILPLYAGTDLRYKYTQGDGLWNAERDEAGAFLTRQVVLPEHDVTLQESVARWDTAGSTPVTLRVSVPGITPPGDRVSLQLNPFTWFAPLPMSASAPNQWSLTLLGPLDFEFPVTYRYCRNQQCDSAVEAETGEADGRQFLPQEPGGDRDDTVTAWKDYPGPSDPPTVVAPEIGVRAGMQGGVEIVPRFDASWPVNPATWMDELQALGANAVILTPAWRMGGTAGVPNLAMDPAIGPLSGELNTWINEARSRGIEPVLHPALRPPDDALDEWWSSSTRDGAWWTVWFEQYRGFVLSYAKLADAAGVEKLVLGGSEIVPALPGGRLPDGTSSSAPADADLRWRQLIEEVRSVYPGTVAFEIEFGRTLQVPPPFLEMVDEVHVQFHPPLAASEQTTVEQMAANANALIQDGLLATPALAGKPLVLSIEVPSVKGALTGCVPGGGTCLPASAFDAGQPQDPSVAVDLSAQSNAYNAILFEAYDTPEIVGVFARRYNPSAALQDGSASVNGKPSRDVLWYWYTRMLPR